MKAAVKDIVWRFFLPVGFFACFSMLGSHNYQGFSGEMGLEKSFDIAFWGMVLSGSASALGFLSLFFIKKK